MQGALVAAGLIVGAAIIAYGLMNQPTEMSDCVRIYMDWRDTIGDPATKVYRGLEIAEAVQSCTNIRRTY